MTTEPGSIGESNVQRWGGLAAVLGGLLLILVFGIVGVFVGMDFVEVTRFPEVRAARIVENGLYLAVLILWIVHLVALQRALRSTSPAPALFGSVLGVVGLAVLAADALHHIWQTPIADLYHAAGATPEDRLILESIWQVSHGIFDALLAAGLVIGSIGVTLLGLAMVRAPSFGARYGGVSLALGTLALASSTFNVVAGPSPIAAVAVLAFIVFHLVIGSKLYRTARTVQPST